MNMQEFLDTYGSNTQSKEAWIFNDSPSTVFQNTFELVGLFEKTTGSGKIMPILQVMDVESKVRMNISLWSTDKQLEGIDIGTKLKVSIGDTGKLALTKVEA